MEALGASDSRAQLSECHQDVALSPKKKRKVGNPPTVAETKKTVLHHPSSLRKQ